MFESSAYRNQAWRCCYAGAEGGDTTLQLELGGLDLGVAALDLDEVASLVIVDKHIKCVTAFKIIQINLSHHFHLSAALHRPLDLPAVCWEPVPT